jgi:hypothetical protein
VEVLLFMDVFSWFDGNSLVAWVPEFVVSFLTENNDMEILYFGWYYIFHGFYEPPKPQKLIFHI